jgi:hypothetical protein
MNYVLDSSNEGVHGHNDWFASLWKQHVGSCVARHFHLVFYVRRELQRINSVKIFRFFVSDRNCPLTVAIANLPSRKSPSTLLHRESWSV